jgi:hypothetical protein
VADPSKVACAGSAGVSYTQDLAIAKEVGDRAGEGNAGQNLLALTQAKAEAEAKQKQEEDTLHTRMNSEDGGGGGDCDSDEGGLRCELHSGVGGGCQKSMLEGPAGRKPSKTAEKNTSEKRVVI